MKRSKIIEYPDDVFDQAKKSFSINILSFDKELEKLEPDDFLPRYNKIGISLKYRAQYTQPILFLKILRSNSDIEEDNFYSFPLHVGKLKIGHKYEIEFLHFDKFNLPFENIEVSIISSDDYSKRKLNTNAADRALKQTINIYENA